MSLFINIPSKSGMGNPKKVLIQEGKCMGMCCFRITKQLTKRPILIEKTLPARITKRAVTTCKTRFEDGCPEYVIFSEELKNKRIKDGWFTSIS